MTFFIRPNTLAYSIDIDDPWRFNGYFIRYANAIPIEFTGEFWGDEIIIYNPDIDNVTKNQIKGIIKAKQLYKR